MTRPTAPFPCSHLPVTATHSIYSCDGNHQQQDIAWATSPASNWPLSFSLPTQVEPLTVTNYTFGAENRYAQYQEISWSLTFFLTPILANQETLGVDIRGNGTVTSTDGFINCPGTCSHSYPQGTQVTLNATPAQGSTFIGWGNPCSGTGIVHGHLDATDHGQMPSSRRRLEFVAYQPCRVVDTRNPNGPFGGPPLQAGRHGPSQFPWALATYRPARRLFAECDGCSAGQLGYLTVWPTGEDQPAGLDHEFAGWPHQSQRRHRARGRQRGRERCMPPTPPMWCLTSTATSAPGGSHLQFYPLTPCRVLDTRKANGDLGGPHPGGGTERDFPVLESSVHSRQRQAAIR